MRFTYHLLVEEREPWQHVLKGIAWDLADLSSDDSDDRTVKRARFVELLGDQHRLAVGQAINPCPRRVSAPRATYTVAAESRRRRTPCP